ncbi:MAG TPA: MFS transporter, partial [Stellaceae bacterium]|nr:MFS transporter [Stellaceae bacterium]
MVARPPTGPSRQKTLLNRVVAATVAVQVAIVMASLTVPVLASAIAPAVGVPSYWVGYYSALIYGCAALSSFVTPRFFRRWGGIRLHQGMLVMVAGALVLLLPAWAAGFAASAIVLGLAYGPMNPASTVLMTRYTPPQLRARVFSFKQTAVPLGGTLAGVAAPLVAAALGWRGALALVAALCLGLSALIQPWRGAIDGDTAAAEGGIAVRFWRPLQILGESAGLRAVTIASFAFGALQFSFVAVFPTVLAHVGWSTTDAGRAMSVALVVGVVLRVPWG